MKKAVLLFSGSAPQDSDNAVLIRWNRGAGNEISLQEELDKNLIQIRNEHMRWAYEMGELEIQPGISLQKLFEQGAAPSMWWTSLLYERHPKLSPDLYIIYKIRCLELLLDKLQCASLLCVNGGKAISALIADLCLASGREFASVGQCPEKKRQGLLRSIYSHLPAPVRAGVRYAHWWLSIRRKLPFYGAIAPEHGGRPPATITTYFPNIDMKLAGEGRFRSRYWENLQDALNEEAAREGAQFVRWLFIRFPAPQLTFSQCLKLRDLFRKKKLDGLGFYYLEEFLSHGDLWASLGRWLKICLKSLGCQKQFAKSCHFQDSKFNFWPLVSGQWAESFRGWRCLERCLQNLAFKRYCGYAGPQRWTLFPLENCPWERMLTQAARSQQDNGPVFGVQHSIIRPTDFRYFDDPRTFANPDCNIFQPDKIGGNGASACGQWLANGMPRTRLVQVEALRYLYITENGQSRPESQLLPPDPGEPVLLPSPKRMMILTSFFADETDAHLKLLGEALDNGLFADWQIDIKPHPYLPVNQWLEKRPTKQRARIFLLDSPLSLLLRPGICVWASNSTTAALEAALKRLPLMVMLPENDFDLCPIQNVPGLLRTGNLNDVRHGLENLRPLNLNSDYLDLNPHLPAWRQLLGLSRDKA